MCDNSKCCNPPDSPINHLYNQKALKSSGFSSRFFSLSLSLQSLDPGRGKKLNMAEFHYSQFPSDHQTGTVLFLQENPLRACTVGQVWGGKRRRTTKKNNQQQVRTNPSALNQFIKTILCIHNPVNSSRSAFAFRSSICNCITGCIHSPACHVTSLREEATRHSKRPALYTNKERFYTRFTS